MIECFLDRGSIITDVPNHPEKEQIVETRKKNYNVTLEIMLRLLENPKLNSYLGYFFNFHRQEF